MVLSCQKALSSLPLWMTGLIYAGVGTFGVLSGGAWAAFVLAGSVLLVFSISCSERLFPKPHTYAAFLALVVLSLAWLSTWHAFDPDTSVYSAIKLTGFVIPLIFLSSPRVIEAGRRALPYLPGWSFVLSSFLVLLSLLLVYFKKTYGTESSEVTKLNRGFSYILLLIWPVLAYGIAIARQGKRGYKAAVITLVLTSVVAFAVTHSRATQVGTLLAGAVFAVALILPRLVFWGVGFFSLMFVGWPFYVQKLFLSRHELLGPLPHSWKHRMEIWDYFSYRISESPFWGYGIGNAHNLDWKSPHGALYEVMSKSAAHPHNVVTQLWVELGAGGLSVYLLMVVGALAGISRLEVRLRPYALASYVSALCLALFAYDFWTDSLWAAMALTAFTFAVVARSKLSQC